MQRIVLLILVPLLFSELAKAEFDEAALSQELIYLGGHTEAILTFAGAKPISTVPTRTMTAAKLAEQLDLAVENNRLTGRDFSWAPNSTGVTRDGEIQFYHHSAIRRQIQRPECQPYLNALGISSSSSVEAVIETFQRVSRKPDSAKSHAEIAFMGIMVGIPPTQVDSYLESLRTGTKGSDGRKFFSWFSSTGAIGGFTTFPNDKNTEELKALRAKSQTIWDQFFLDIHSRGKNPLRVLTFFDQEPFRENPLTRYRCMREVAEFLGL